MCGIFGIYGAPDAATLCHLGLHTLQHRGQESVGLAVADGERVRHRHAPGLVVGAFTPLELARLRGRAAIGHVRYSTVGGSEPRNAQPIVGDLGHGRLAVVHNGQLAGYAALRAELVARGAVFQTDTDTEALLHLVAASRAPTLPERIREALARVSGAYSLLFLAADILVAARDPHGIRPLCIGLGPGRGGAHGAPGRPAVMVASEPAPFELLGGRVLRDVAPGELLVIEPAGMRSLEISPPRPTHGCLFEHVYFARADAVLDGVEVYELRKRAGARLAVEHPIPAVSGARAIVVPVPDSGLPAAVGFAQQAVLPFELGLVRNHYVGRTFIEPRGVDRSVGVRLKLSPNPSAVRGRRVVVVDDSIVRGTTSRQLVAMLRAAGAREVHLRVASPPTAWPCYYGFDTPRAGELLAASHATGVMARWLGVDSLGFVSLDGLLAAADGARIGAAPSAPGRGYCHACFSGHYPLPIDPVVSERSRRREDRAAAEASRADAPPGIAGRAALGEPVGEGRCR